MIKVKIVIRILLINTKLVCAILFSQNLTLIIIIVYSKQPSIVLNHYWYRKANYI